MYIQDGRLACSGVASLAVMSGIDPVEETEVEISSERPGLESPVLELRNLDLCTGKELRRSTMTPECGDRVRVSLQPAIISCGNTKQLKIISNALHSFTEPVFNCLNILKICFEDDHTLIFVA